MSEPLQSSAGANTWDRFYDYGAINYYHKARLTKVEVSNDGYITFLPPVWVGNHCGGQSVTPPQTLYAGTPRVAWEPGARLMVAFTTRQASGAPKSCQLCVETFDTPTLAYVAFGYLWSDLSSYPYFDIEWNGYNRFMVVDELDPDGPTLPTLATDLFDRDAVWHTSATLETSLIAQPVRVVFSDNSHNINQRLLAHTNTRTYWIYQSGGLRGMYAPGSRFQFAACEYWGPGAHAGHTYENPGTGSLFHQHWPTIPGSPTEYRGVTWRIPLACSAADGFDPNDFTDPEIAIVGRIATDPGYLYWNLESED